MASNLRTWLAEEIAKIEANDLFARKPADMRINAPVAVMQIGLKTRHEVLRECMTRLDKEEADV